jgi:hypothetical protein
MATGLPSTQEIGDPLSGAVGDDDVDVHHFDLDALAERGGALLRGER